MDRRILGTTTAPSPSDAELLTLAVARVLRGLAVDTDVWSDPVWLVDSTPVECARSRPTVQRSDLAGWAGYG